MRNYKMVLQYDGTRYNGWQSQGNTENTIQGKLQQVLGKMTGMAVVVQGSGRTDAGVHAAGQVANMLLDTGLTERQIQNYLNRYLPEDIRILQLEQVGLRFHSRLNAIQKCYLYRIEMGEKRDVFQRKYTYGLGTTLDLKAMSEAAERLCGTHDFRSFCANKVMKKSTIRKLFEIAIESNGSELQIRYVGSGFLQQMVRIMTGTLIEVGQHKRTAASVTETIQACSRSAAGFTAPAQGLCLINVDYSQSDRSRA